MELESNEINGALVIRVFAERIDSAAAIRFKDALRAAATATEEPAQVVLDLGRVDFVDSSGLGAIVAAMKFLAPARRLDLAALKPEVSRVFRLTRMDTIFNIYDSVDAACAAKAAG